MQQGKGVMETFWLIGHEKLKEENLLPLQFDEIYHSTICEPEFLQMIWIMLNIRECQLMLGKYKKKCVEKSSKSLK